MRAKPLAASVAFTLGLSVLTLGDGSASTLGTVARALADAAAVSVAAARIVTNCDDSGAGSLRDTVASAQSGDTLDLTGLPCGTITLESTLMIDVDDLALRGPGADRLSIVSDAATGNQTVIEQNGAGTLSIDSLRISGGFYCVYSRYSGNIVLNATTITGCGDLNDRSEYPGAGVFVRGGLVVRNSTITNNSGTGVTAGGTGDVSIEGTTISGNVASQCAGFHVKYRSGTARISNSTISGNHSTFDGGAGCANVPLTISNSTIAFNSTRLGVVGGLAVYGSGHDPTPEVTIESSIMAKNFIVTDTGVATAGNDLSRGIPRVAGHNNLIMSAGSVPADTRRDDPLLLPLADNGGPTLTHAPAAGSPAIDAGANAGHLDYDQRGAPRVAGAAPDIGAVEVQPGTSAVPFIGPGFTGNWYDASHVGHGFAFEVLPGNIMLLEWFVFAPQGGQAWVVGTGPIIGNSAAIQAYQKVGSGGLFPPAFNAALLQDQFWGTITLTFADCNNGTASWVPVVSGYTAGSTPLQRLTLPAGLKCP